MFIKMIEPSKQVLDQIQGKLAEFTDQPFRYDFITDKYDELYRNETKLTKAILNTVMDYPQVEKASVRVDKPFALRFADSVSIELIEKKK